MLEGNKQYNSPVDCRILGAVLLQKARITSTGVAYSTGCHLKRKITIDRAF
jgi:hypothetical protein